MNTNEFLQSEAWAKLQTAAGHEAVRIGDDDPASSTDSAASAGVGFVHTLPMIGKYVYTPRFPESGIENLQSIIENLFATAGNAGAKWVRVEPETKEVLEIVRNEIETLRQAQGDKERGGMMIVRAPHDMQPRETFVIDIAKSEEELLSAMKPKTRYNIRLAEKKGVRVFATRERKYQEAFLDLITATAERKDIVPHPRSYYEKFFTELPEDMCFLFVAEYEGAVVAANLVMVYGGRATYLHGGSGDRYREVMAPFMLQWEQIKFAKARGCTKYDFGGVRTTNNEQRTTNNGWAGITRFKTGFSPKTPPTVFPGCYDIVLDKRSYKLYAQLRFIQKAVSSMKKLFRI